jgi:hypothetical protein
VCGETPTLPGHCKRKRRAKHSGKKVQLPPPRAAEDLFRTALALLRNDADNLSRYEEHLQGERFVAAYEDPDPVVLVLRRDRYSKEQWEKRCRFYGVDPATEIIRDPSPGELGPLGANRQPLWPLTRLIAAYVLSGKDLQRLIVALHPEPASAEEARVESKVEELKLVAGQLATLVRGGELRTGPSTGEISEDEHYLAWDISRLRDAGLADKQILQEIRLFGYMAYDRPLTLADVRRLGKLQLKPPN